jgi:hypothetical protein
MGVFLKLLLGLGRNRFTPVRPPGQVCPRLSLYEDRVFAIGLLLIVQQRRRYVLLW